MALFFPNFEGMGVKKPSAYPETNSNLLEGLINLCGGVRKEVIKMYRALLCAAAGAFASYTMAAQVGVKISKRTSSKRLSR
jgi:hypothetical protein